MLYKKNYYRFVAGFIGILFCFIFMFHVSDIVFASITNDTFTGSAATLLENHTSDSGNTWSKNTGVSAGQLVITDANRIRGNLGSAVVDINNWTPPTTDYEVSADLYIASASYNQIGIGGRAGTSSFTGYYALLTTGPVVRLFRGGNATPLGSYTPALNAGETHNIKLRMVGNNIQVLWDGNTVINVTPAGADIISTAGQAAVYSQGSFTNTTGVHLDNFLATDTITTPTLSPTVTPTNTPTPSNTPTPTNSPTPTLTPSPTPTPIFTAGTLSLTSKTSSSVVVSWTAASNGSGSITSQLQRSAFGAGSWVSVSGATSSPATDNTVSQMTNYNYRVAFTDLNGTIYSNIISVKTDATSNTAYRSIVQSESNLLYYWPMDESTGTTMVSSKGDINLTLSGATPGNTGQIDGTAVSFNGTSNYGVTASAINLTPYNKIVVEALMNIPAPDNTLRLGWELTTNTNSNNTGFFMATNETTQNPRIFSVLLNGNVGYNYGFYTLPTANSWHHVTAVYDKSLATNEVSLYIDGALVTPSSRPANLNNTNAFANALFYIMSRAGSSLFGQGSMQHLAIYSDLSSSRISAHSEAANIATPTPTSSPTPTPTSTPSTTYTVTASDIWDNGYDNVSSPRQSTFAHILFNTNAASVNVTGTTTIYGSFPQWAHLGVRVNGIEQSPLAFSANGSQTFSVSLGSAGTSKNVEITTGLQSRPSGTVIGTFIDSISYPNTSSFSILPPTVGNRTVVYGDSISVGANATNPESEGYIPLLRNLYSLNVMLEGWGYRSLYDDANTSILRNSLVSRITGYAPATIWLAIGTNDYGLNKWSAANFGTAYSALLDDLHSSLPSARIICQTPIVRTNESANTFGNTLANYRTQINTACSSRSWTTSIDGSAFLTTSDLQDGVHPTTSGHAKYAKRIAPALSQPSYTVLGPSSGIDLATSSPFTVSISKATFLGDQSIILSDNNSNGIFNSSTNHTGTNSLIITPSNGATSFTFTYTPASSGTKTLSFSNSQSWSNPNTISYNPNAVVSTSTPTPEPSITLAPSPDTSSTSFSPWVDSKGDTYIFEPALPNNMESNELFPTFKFIEANGNMTINKYQILISSIDTNERVYIDNIVANGDDFEDDNRYVRYNKSEHTITVKGKADEHELKPGAYKWKIRAYSNTSTLDSEERILRVQTKYAFFSSPSLVFPISILSIDDLQTNISTQNTNSIPNNPLYINTTSPKFYGITNSSADITLTLVRQVKSHQGSWNDTYTFKDKADLSSRYTLQVSPALPEGQYTVKLSATNGSNDYIELPSFSIFLSTSKNATKSITPSKKKNNNSQTSKSSASILKISATPLPTKKQPHQDKPKCILWFFCK